MYPHERSLVKRLADQPFALLGINSDEDRKGLKKVLVDEKITWRNWWDGGTIEGPIATKWQVDDWPTLYVLDAEGVIRHVDASGADANMEAVERVVDLLVKELADRSN